MKVSQIDLIRAVPETAVRLYCGAQARSVGDSFRLTYEGKSVSVSPEVFFQAEYVVKIIRLRPRMIRLVQDVLDLRHEAEDIYLEMIFEKRGLPKVLFVPAGMTASGYYRAMIPAEMMTEGGRTISHFTMSVDIAKVLRYDILWIQLITGPVLAAIARKAQESGVKVVYDIDDRLDSIPDENQAKTVYGTPEKQAEIDEMIRLADLVTVSTKPLAAHLLARGAKAARVLPNMITANVLPRRQTPDPSITRIIWAGSATHRGDLAIAARAIRDVLLRHDGKVRFTLFGERIPEAIADAYKFIDLIKPVDFDEYHDTLAGLAADFGIAPLAVNSFNESKSAIKALEYAAAGYPMLLSPVGEYPGVVDAGLPAWLVPDDKWEEALERMIAHTPQERDRMGKDCIKWVCENRCIGKTKASAWSEVALDLAGEKVEVEAAKEG